MLEQARKHASGATPVSSPEPPGGLGQRQSQQVRWPSPFHNGYSRATRLIRTNQLAVLRMKPRQTDEDRWTLQCPPPISAVPLATRPRIDAPAGRTGADRPSTVCGSLPRIFLAGGPPYPMLESMNAVTLPPDLERFADEVIAKGRFRDVDEVVRAGVSLLQRAEAERAAFEASLDNAIAEGERDGFLTLDEVMRDADALLEEMANSRK